MSLYLPCYGWASSICDTVNIYIYIYQNVSCRAHVSYIIMPAVTSSDICRWVESGAIPFNTALSEIPIWLFEASGVCDKYSKFSAFPSVLRQDMIFRDRSVIQVAEPVRVSNTKVLSRPSLS